MPTSSPLNSSVTGSSINEVASSTAACAADVVSSGSTCVSAGDSVRAPVSDAFASDAPSRRASTPSPGRAGMTSRPLRTTTCARRGFGSAADTRAATSSTSGRATSTWSTTRVGGLGSTIVRIRPTKLVRPAFQSACWVAAASTRSASAGLTSYVFPPTTTRTGVSSCASRSSTPGSGRSQ